VPSHVRAAATVGGNCAPEVTGCVYLVLLSLAAKALVVTAQRIEQRPLSQWQRPVTGPAAAGSVALVQLRWSQGEVAGGGFARSADRDADGRPLCAVAVTATPEPALRIVIGYLTQTPVILTTTGDGEPAVARWAAQHAPTLQHELAACLRRAMSTL
jgi:CO/xanthine dehydrogenase FAD-binding subunit